MIARPLTSLLLLTACVVLLAPVAARAQVSADDLGFGLQGSAQFSKSKPQIVLRPSIPFASVRFDCTRSDGQKVTIQAAGLKPGSEKRLVVPQGKGVFQYKCSVSGKSGKQTFQGFELEFETKVGAPPRIELKQDDVDEEKRQITVRLSEPAGKIELDVYGDDGKPIDNVTQPFHGEAAGTPLVVHWKQEPGEVMGRFSLRAHDPAGFWSGVESVTFVDIPHEDVVFESGKWDVRPSEEGKLTAPLAQILANLKKVQGILQVTLYIGGYTDTVGSAADNLELSRKRAQAIGQWFAKKGVTTGIQFQGFGETVSKVATPDNTDEARNRRASYVLSTQPPPASRGFPARNWSRAR
jgi:outer membrane protein OmpA-like peptidoglycan-associated protein